MQDIQKKLLYAKVLLAFFCVTTIIIFAQARDGVLRGSVGIGIAVANFLLLAVVSVFYIVQRSRFNAYQQNPYPDLNILTDVKDAGRREKDPKTK